MPILPQLLRAEMAEREMRLIVDQMKSARVGQILRKSVDPRDQVLLLKPGVFADPPYPGVQGLFRPRFCGQ